MKKLGLVSFVIFGVFVACSCGSQPSVNSSIEHPGELLAEFRFDVSPRSESVTVTPVGSPWTSDTIGGDGSGNIPNVTVTSANVSYTDPTLSFDVVLNWQDPSKELANTRLAITGSTNLSVVNESDDRCPPGTPWGECLVSSESSVTFVSDSSLEGPATETVCDSLGNCTIQELSSISAGCGSVASQWQLTETSGSGYTFWTLLYGETTPVNPIEDPRYDQYTATIFMRTRKLTYATTNVPAAGAEATSMLPNEWFYAHIAMDSPGNNQSFPAYNWEMDADGHYLGPQHIEDTGNIAAYANATYSTASYWYAKFAGFEIRWDNAIVETAANSDSVPPLGGFKFCTSKGTRLMILKDPNTTTDGTNFAAAGYNSSNALGRIRVIGPTSWLVAAEPNPCALQYLGSGCPSGVLDGFENRNIDAVHIPLHVKSTAPIGSGSYVRPSYNDSTVVIAYNTLGTPYNLGDDYGEWVYGSPNWPDWCDPFPDLISCNNKPYNTERGYICVE